MLVNKQDFPGNASRYWKIFIKYNSIIEREFKTSKI